MKKSLREACCEQWPDGLGSRSFYSLKRLEEHTGVDLARIPKSLRVVLESLLRNCDGLRVTEEDVISLARWKPNAPRESEIPFVVGRVVLNDMAGIPMLCDLAAMRDAAKAVSPASIAPTVPVDMVIDHALSVDYHGSQDALRLNMKLEIERNKERFRFVKWAMQAFKGIRLIPPGFGILHQINLEHLSPGVLQSGGVIYPDTLVGTDSHTCMIAGLGVVGWGVGGIEAESAMLGEPVNFLTPDVIGVQLSGQLRPGATSTDLVLHVTELLRREKVVGTFVEFFGAGARRLTVQDRATIANMAVEYGATIGFFPADVQTFAYLLETGREPANVTLAQEYFEAQGMYAEANVDYSRVVKLDLGEVESCVAGPNRPQDRVGLSQVKSSFRAFLGGGGVVVRNPEIRGRDEIRDGDVLIAAITSCTNTSNPSVMVAAGLLAKNARKRGLGTKHWVKTSLTPGSVVVSRYLQDTGLQSSLDELGFNVAGYSCATCVGNSGPLDSHIEQMVQEKKLTACAALSGNRNFEGRIHPSIKAAYLMSPPLVVAYAIAGTMDMDPELDPLGNDETGTPVYLRDIWPDAEELARLTASIARPDYYISTYRVNFEERAGPLWKGIPQPSGDTYAWEPSSTYIQRPPYFTDPDLQQSSIKDIRQARALLVLGDSITTDHISPIGSIDPGSPAANYLRDRGIVESDFNSYGARRMNHEVMVRGGFSNIRLRNRLAGGKEGGYTVHQPSGRLMSIYDAALKYRADGVPLVVVAGEEYGTGSARDWAAKAPRLLGVRAVIAKSFERIHRSNLVGMGILPCELLGDVDAIVKALDGTETFSIHGIEGVLRPRERVVLSIEKNGMQTSIPVILRIDTPAEMACLRLGGILQYMLSTRSVEK